MKLTKKGILWVCMSGPWSLEHDTKVVERNSCKVSNLKIPCFSELECKLFANEDMLIFTDQF